MPGVRPRGRALGPVAITRNLGSGEADRENMRRALSVQAIAAVLTAAQTSRAVDSPDDVETDHIDAVDDGGPRSVGFLLHPILMAAGWFGAEVDASCGEHLLLSVEGDGRFAWTHGVRAALGVALFPQRFSFHGIYAHPTFEWNRVWANGVAATVLGGAITVGYAWTWPSGPTFRLGGGVEYAKGTIGSGQALFARELEGSTAPLERGEGWRPRVDANVGWVF